MKGIYTCSVKVAGVQELIMKPSQIFINLFKSPCTVLFLSSVGLVTLRKAVRKS